MALTAGTPLDVLVVRLRRAGWGDLNTPTLRGLHRVLEDLGHELDRRSGAGKVTAHQIAARVGYTEKWVRRCLGLLEELQLIQWERGGIVGGKPVPSWVRVSKAVLVDLIHAARAKEATRDAARATETRLRVAALRTSYTRPAKRKPKRSSAGRPHAEVVTALRSTEEVHPASRLVGVGCKDEKDEAPASPDSAQSAIARIRADLAARRGRRPGEKRSDDEVAGRVVSASV